LEFCYAKLQSQKSEGFLTTEQGGFGVPVANILFAPSTPVSAFPGTSCTGLYTQGLRLKYYSRNATFRIPQYFG
jgi:hypothetical protein